jgi:hypothetical protein
MLKNAAAEHANPLVPLYLGHLRTGQGWSVGMLWEELRTTQALLQSLDWFKGKFTGNHGFYHQI